MKLCACGCGQPVVGRRSSAVYASAACKARSQNQRRRVAHVAAQEIASRDLSSLKPSARRVLRALQAAGAGGATTHELGQAAVGGHRFGARLLELREFGFRIDAAYQRPGSYRYFLREHDNVRRLFDVTRAAAVAERQEAA